MTASNRTMTIGISARTPDNPAQLCQEALNMVKGNKYPAKLQDLLSRLLVHTQIPAFQVSAYASSMNLYLLRQNELSR